VKILDRVPYSSEATFVSAPGGTVRVKPYQIVVVVSVSLPALLEWDPRMPRVPAILDTGNNHNLPISREHLLRWAGLQPEALRISGAMRDSQQRIPLHAASVWLQKNRPGERALREQEPHPLKLQQGIAVYPDDIGPRLPVLGLRALTENQLQVAIDPVRMRVNVRSPDWGTKVLSWLGRWL
jgi:hypothetical protein